MIIKNDIDLSTFEAWGGAYRTLEIVIEHNLIEDLDEILSDLYPDGIGDVELNDLLWFSGEMVLEWLGIKGGSDDED